MRSYLIIPAVLAIVIVLAAMACQPSQQAGGPSGGDGERLQETQNGGAADQEATETEEQPPTTVEGEGGVEVTDEGGGTIKVTDKEGETEIEVTATLPAGWPEDVPVMEGFTIIGSQSVTQQGEWKDVKTVQASGDAPLEEISDFYSKLPGWVLDENLPNMTSGERILLNFTKGDERLTVMSGPGGGEWTGKTLLTLVHYVSE